MKKAQVSFLWMHRYLHLRDGTNPFTSKVKDCRSVFCGLREKGVFIECLEVKKGGVRRLPSVFLGVAMPWAFYDNLQYGTTDVAINLILCIGVFGKKTSLFLFRSCGRRWSREGRAEVEWVELTRQKRIPWMSSTASIHIFLQNEHKKVLQSSGFTANSTRTINAFSSLTGAAIACTGC